MTRAEFEALASAAESHFIGWSFHASKMFPQIGDWLSVLELFTHLLFFPQLSGYFVFFFFGHYQRHPADQLATKEQGDHGFLLPCFVGPATSCDLRDL